MKVRSCILCVREGKREEGGDGGEGRERWSVCGKKHQSRASKAVRDEVGPHALNYNEWYGSVLNFIAPLFQSLQSWTLESYI